jgi:hypothetical protein
MKKKIKKKVGFMFLTCEQTNEYLKVSKIKQMYKDKIFNKKNTFVDDNDIFYNLQRFSMRQVLKLDESLYLDDDNFIADEFLGVPKNKR